MRVVQNSSFPVLPIRYCLLLRPRSEWIQLQKDPEELVTRWSNYAKLWTRLAGVHTAGKPINACGIAALLPTTAVIDAAGNNAVAVALTAEQVVA